VREKRPQHNRKLLICPPKQNVNSENAVPNVISEYQILAQIEVVMSGETCLQARGFNDRNPFRQRTVQLATYVQLQ